MTRRVPEDIATRKNLDLIDEVFAEDWVEHGPLGEGRGRQSNREMLQSLLDAFPDFEAIVEEIIAEGNTTAMRVTLRGTHEGEFMGIEPTGNAFDIQNMVFTRIEDGTIAERWVIPDTLGLLQQLGVVPPLEELQGMAPQR